MICRVIILMLMTTVLSNLAVLSYQFSDRLVHLTEASSLIEDSVRIKTTSRPYRIISLSGASETKYISIAKGEENNWECRYSQLGTEYAGSLRQSYSGKHCQLWESTSYRGMVDEDMPELSLKKVSNKCRNPNGILMEPWCFVMEQGKIIREQCTVPLCSKSCRQTGVGREYSGDSTRTGTGKDCLPWLHVLDKMKKNITLPLLANALKEEGSKCRNIDEDLSGPWCYVEPQFSTNNEPYVKEYCHTSFCDEIDFVLTSKKKEMSHHVHLMTINENIIEFRVRLWNPTQWKSSKLKLALLSIPLLTLGKTLDKLHSGLEIIISNKAVGLSLGHREETHWEKIPLILNGYKWSDFRVEWQNNLISVELEGFDKPLILYEYVKPKDETVISYQQGFKYVSFMGTGLMVDIKSSKQKQACTEHITMQPLIMKYFEYATYQINNELEFHLRAVETGIIIMKISPLLDYPHVKIKIKCKEEELAVLYISSKNNFKLLYKTNLVETLPYWKWNRFTMSSSSENLRLCFNRESRVCQEIIVISEKVNFHYFKWFGIGSYKPAYWTISCLPEDAAALLVSHPECSLSESGEDYMGHIWYTCRGQPCLPWTALNLEDIKEDDFVDSSKVSALNFCRNPSRDERTFCYVSDTKHGHKIVVKEYCCTPVCKNQECKISGTGVDFLGERPTTRSNRRCISWTQFSLGRYLFPGASEADSRDFCRNPTDNVLGPWCYVNKEHKEIDLCFVQDCDKPDHSTFLVEKSSSNKRIQVKKEWRLDSLKFRVKIWDPNELTSLLILLEPHTMGYFQLVIGDLNNAFITLNHIKSNGQRELLKRVPNDHILSCGQWIGFKLFFKLNEVILAYETLPKILLHWKGYLDQEINYIAFSSTNKVFIGINVNSDECLTEEIRGASEYDTIYPASLWKTDIIKANKYLSTSAISFHLRGKGDVAIGFFVLHSQLPRLEIRINSGQLIGSLSIYTPDKFIGKDAQLVKRRTYTSLLKPIIKSEGWTNITIMYSNFTLIILKNDEVITEWTSPTYIGLYYFSIKTSSGSHIYWTVNCQPLDIDGEPVDSGWSEWSPWFCPVTCGGAIGYRIRTCDKPKLSYFGKICEGPNVMNGACNTFPCGEIPPDVETFIKGNLTSKATTVLSEWGNSVILNCVQGLLQELRHKTPMAAFVWSKNGYLLAGSFLLKDGSSEAMYNLNISRARSSDTGLYACLIRSPKGKTTLLRVISLIVSTDAPTDFVSKGNDYLLTCNSIELTRIFAGLFMVWSHNNRIKPPVCAEENEMYLRNVSLRDEGVWICNVTNNALLTWTTNVINIKVLSASGALRRKISLDNTRTKTRRWKRELVSVVTICFVLIISALSLTTIVFFVLSREAKASGHRLEFELFKHKLLNYKLYFCYRCIKSWMDFKKQPKTI